MKHFANAIKTAINWIVRNRLNYLASTSAMLLVIHMPPTMSVIAGMSFTDSIMTLLHLVIGSAWLVGFLPFNLLSKLFNRFNQSTQPLINAFTSERQRILSSYALTH